MGHATSLDSVRCCQEEELRSRCPIELDTDCTACHTEAASSSCEQYQLRWDPAQSGVGEPVLSESAHYQDEQHWGWCRPDPGSHEDAAPVMGVDALEALSYMPVRYDVDPAIDVERSHARYSQMVVHSSRARTQKCSKAWEEWLRAAVTGRSITLLTMVPQGFQNASVTLARVSATYYLDHNLTKFSIVPASEASLSCIPILVDSIQVVCPATDFTLFFDQMDGALNESEKNRAVLVKYGTGEWDRKRVCFLEESDLAKEQFVQALTALWLEKRNGHSMWF